MVDTKGGHVCHSPQYPPTLVQDSDSDSGASSSGGGCSVSGLVGEINVHVCAIFSAQQSHSEITCHPRSSLRNTDCSLYWWPSQPWFPDLLRLCVDHPMNLCRRSLCSFHIAETVSAGSEIHLGWKVVPSARMEALMQHYKATGFSDEVSRLVTAPRRPSTNCMYDDWWLHFTHWAARKGFDLLNPTAAQIATFCTLFLIHMGYPLKLSKGYRTCLGSAKLKWFSTRLSPI